MATEKKLNIDENDFGHRKCLNILDKMFMSDKKDSEKTKVKKTTE